MLMTTKKRKIILSDGASGETVDLGVITMR